MNRIKLFFLVLSVFACSKGDCMEESSPLDSRYIVLESKEGERFCLPYSGLRFITPFDSLKLSLGKEEREDITCGIKKLGTKDFQEMENKHDVLLYKINDFDPGQTKILTGKILDSSGIFSLRDIEYNLRGAVINNAIGRGYVIRLAEDKSAYLWKK